MKKILKVLIFFIIAMCALFITHVEAALPNQQESGVVTYHTGLLQLSINQGHNLESKVYIYVSKDGKIIGSHAYDSKQTSGILAKNWLDITDKEVVNGDKLDVCIVYINKDEKSAIPSVYDIIGAKLTLLQENQVIHGNKLISYGNKALGTSNCMYAHIQIEVDGLGTKYNNYKLVFKEQNGEEKGNCAATVQYEVREKPIETMEPVIRWNSDRFKTEYEAAENDHGNDGVRIIVCQGNYVNKDFNYDENDAGNSYPAIDLTTIDFQKESDITIFAYAEEVGLDKKVDNAEISVSPASLVDEVSSDQKWENEGHRSVVGVVRFKFKNSRRTNCYIYI